MSLVSNMLMIFFLISFVMIHSSNATIQDFCIADLASPMGPAGYPCKSVSKVTVNDFVKPQFLKTSKAFPSFKLTYSSGSASSFPAVNTLHISTFYVALGVGGSAPLHSHPGANEFSVVTEGTIYIGLVTSANRVYNKTLQAGDAIVFPQGLLHFQINVGKTVAKFISSFNSENPRVIFVGNGHLSNNLPSDIVEKMTSLDDDEMKNLTAMFGGTN